MGNNEMSAACLISFETLMTHHPNQIELSTRIWYLILSAILLAYGTFGVWLDDIYVPGKRSPGTHFHGEPAWLIYMAMVSASLSMLSVIVDHYDIRNNEVGYQRFAKVTQALAWALFILALILDLLVFRKGTAH